MRPDADLGHLTRAAELADASAGLTQPHPNSGCVLISADGSVVAESFQRAQVRVHALRGGEAANRRAEAKALTS